MEIDRKYQNRCLEKCIAFQIWLFWIRIYVNFSGCIPPYQKGTSCSTLPFSRGYGTSPNETTKFHLPLTLKPSKSPLMRWCDDFFKQIHSGCWCLHVSCSCFKQIVWHTNINHWIWHDTLVVMMPGIQFLTVPTRVPLANLSCDHMTTE